MSKKLIRSKEYQKVLAYQTQLYLDLTNIKTGFVLPCFKDGFYFVPDEFIDKVDARIQEGIFGLSELVERLCVVYPDQHEVAKVRLERDGLYVESDFPTVEELKGKFSIDYNFFRFEVSENLPAEMRKVELEKLEKSFDASRDIVTNALTEGFSELLGGLTSKLTQKAGTEKLIFRDSLFEDLCTFMGTFQAKNLGNDEKLNKLVEQANGIFAQITGGSAQGKAQVLRDSEQLRVETKAAFTSLKVAVDQSLIERPSRRFSFSE